MRTLGFTSPRNSFFVILTAASTVSPSLKGNSSARTENSKAVISVLPFFSASLKCLPSPIGVILDIFILNSPKHGSSLPAPNGSSNSRLFIKSIFMYAGFSLQSSLSSGNGISAVFAYSFIAVRNSSILLFSTPRPAARV